MSSVLLLFFAIAGCGHVSVRKPTLHGGRSRVLQSSAQASATLPAGYNPITSLAGDPTGSGVWFWDDTNSDLSIFRVDGQGTVKSWPALSGAAGQFQAISGFTVTSGGIAWLGINSTLTRLDSSSGAIQTWQVPAPADDPAAESYQPAELKGQHLVQGIAVSPNGNQVAIAMTSASSVEVLDVPTGTFTQIAMPATSEGPLAVAYAPDGTLGIGIANYSTHQDNAALIVGPGDANPPVVVSVPDSSAITGDGASGFIAGSSQPYLLSTDGTATPIAAPSASFPPVQAGPAISVTSGGDLAAITSAGVIEFPGNASSVASATAASVTLQLPAEQCPPEQPSGAGGTLTPQPSPTGLCHPEADAMAVDDAGGVWVVPGDNAERVERLDT